MVLEGFRVGYSLAHTVVSNVAGHPGIDATFRVTRYGIFPNCG